MNKYKNLLIVSLLGIFLLGAGRAYFGATNFDRLVLGEGNFETDPNPTADLTFQNDEYIDNATNGRLNFGAANLLTTGTVGGGAGTFTTISGTYLFSDANVGRARLTVGTVAGTGAGKLYLGDSLYHATTLVMDGSRNLLNIGTIGSGAITSTGAISGTNGTFSGDLAVNGGDVTATEDTLNLFNATVTKANVLGAGTDISFGASTGTFTVNNATLSAKALTLTGLATFAATGQVLALRTIAEGDSVFLKTIVDAADTTLKVWNGTAWVTVKDLIP